MFHIISCVNTPRNGKLILEKTFDWCVNIHWSFYHCSLACESIGPRMLLSMEVQQCFMNLFMFKHSGNFTFFWLECFMKFSSKDDAIFQCHASTMCKSWRRGVKGITTNCDITNHMSFTSWFHVYFVSKGVFGEMFKGCVVDT